MKQRLGNDICRCQGLQCPQRDSCLRYTDRPDGQRLPFTTSLYNIKDGNECAYKITLEVWEKT